MKLTWALLISTGLFFGAAARGEEEVLTAESALKDKEAVRVMNAFCVGEDEFRYALQLAPYTGWRNAITRVQRDLRAWEKCSQNNFRGYDLTNLYGTYVRTLGESFRVDGERQWAVEIHVDDEAYFTYYKEHELRLMLQVEKQQSNEAAVATGP